MDNRSIGVFDSGIGGLTVVKELTKILPNEKIVYFGDTARVPYGTRSEETIKRFSKECIEFLNQKDIKALIIACNTVSAVALEMLKELFDMYILGVIIPGSKMASYVTKNKKIGVIGTNATVLSGAYEKCIKSENSENIVYSKACPLFVPIVEEGLSNTEIALETAKYYLNELINQDVDTIVMGVIIPGSKMASYVTKNKKIGVIGTNATVLSGAYEKCIKSENSENIVYSKACPLFVPIVEEGLSNTEIALETAKYYLNELINQDVDTIVMGCTHYPILENTIKAVVGKDISLVNPAKETANEMKKYLEFNNLLNEESENIKNNIFYITDDENKFKKNLLDFIKIDSPNIKKIYLK